MKNGTKIVSAQTAVGESFAGTLPLKETAPAPRKLGFCSEKSWIIPRYFNRWAEDEIAKMFAER